MGVVAFVAASAAIGAGSQAKALAVLSIDQAPITRVLRLSDVPGWKSAELPSGALSRVQFTSANNRTRSAARAEGQLLFHSRLRSSAISEFIGPGRSTLKSTAVELGSPGLASKALAEEVELSTHTQAPYGTVAHVTLDRTIAGAVAIRFVPSAAGQAGSLELLTRAGRYLLTLQGTDQPDHVSYTTLERLLRTVLSRH